MLELTILKSEISYTKKEIELLRKEIDEERYKAIYKEVYKKEYETMGERRWRIRNGQ